MGSPARRLINPITRCWDHPHYGYAGTDDRQGTDLRLDTKRLTLMSGTAGLRYLVNVRATSDPSPAKHSR
jgi:hypothetical protein